MIYFLVLSLSLTYLRYDCAGRTSVMKWSSINKLSQEVKSKVIARISIAQKNM